MTGTDATHAEHIETIKDRFYVNLNHQNRFQPGELGLGLVEGYDSMGYEMSKPNLRAALEEDLKAICEGRKTKEEVLQIQINAYKNVFIDASRNVEKLDEAMTKYFGQAAQVVPDEMVASVGEPIFECSCKSQVILRKKKDGRGFYMGCRNYPTCRNSVWFPASVLNAVVTDQVCQTCLPRNVKKIQFKFERGGVLFTIPTDHTTCIICDAQLKECLDLDLSVFGRTTAATGVSTNVNALQARSVNVQQNRSFGSSASPNVSTTTRQPLQNHFSQQNRQPTQPRNPAGLGMVNQRNNQFGGNPRGMDTDDENAILCNCAIPAVQKTGEFPL